MKKDMPLEGLRWSRDSGSALCDTSQNSRSRTGWGAHHINLVSMNIVLRPIFTTQSLSAMKNMLGMQDIISLQLKKLST